MQQAHCASSAARCQASRKKRSALGLLREIQDFSRSSRVNCCRRWQFELSCMSTKRPALLECVASPGRYPARSPFTKNLTPQALQRMCFSGGPLRQQGVWKVPQWLQDSAGKYWLPYSQVTGRRHLLTCHQQGLAGIGPSTERAGMLHARSSCGISDEEHRLAANQDSRAKAAARGAAAAC